MFLKVDPARSKSYHLVMNNLALANSPDMITFHLEIFELDCVFLFIVSKSYRIFILFMKSAAVKGSSAGARLSLCPSSRTSFANELDAGSKLLSNFINFQGEQL